MKRKTEYALRSIMPPAARELQRALAVTRRTGGTRQPATLLRSYHSSRLDLLPVGYAFDAGLVVDIGANVGAWTAAILAIAPQARVLVVEPSPEPFEQCRRRFSDLPNVVLENKALGAMSKRGTLFRTASSHNTSLLRPRESGNAMYGWGWDVVDEVTVTVVSLDDLVLTDTVSLLKIDVQGGERDLLLGATQVLRRTSAILIEMTTVSHYEGDADFSWIDNHLKTAGFRLSAFSEFTLSPDQRIISFDASYLAADVEDRHSWLSRYGPGLSL